MTCSEVLAWMYSMGTATTFDVVHEFGLSVNETLDHLVHLRLVEKVWLHVKGTHMKYEMVYRPTTTFYRRVL